MSVKDDMINVPWRVFRSLMIVLTVIVAFIIIFFIIENSATRQTASIEEVFTHVTDVRTAIADIEHAQRLLMVGGKLNEAYVISGDNVTAKLNALLKSSKQIHISNSTIQQTQQSVTDLIDQLMQTQSAWNPNTGTYARDRITENELTRQAAMSNLDSLEYEALQKRDGIYTSIATTSVILTIVIIGMISLSFLRIINIRGKILEAFENYSKSREEQIEKLRKNRSLLMTTTSGIGEGLIAVDAGSRITFMNPIAEKLTSYQESDVMGREISKVVTLISEKTGEKLELPVASVLKNHIDREIAPNALLITPDGSKKPVSGTCLPVWDDTSKVMGAALMLRDTTEKRLAREQIKASQAHTEAIIENALDAVLMLDAEGRIIEYNTAAERIFGYARADLLGKKIEDTIISSNQSDKFKKSDLSQLAIEGSYLLGQRIEINGIGKDKKEIPLEMAVIAVPQQNPPVYAIFMQDIGVRKEAETIREQARITAEEESKAKSQFLNNMSDEMRTPLNAVIGYSEMLQEEASERTPAQFIPDLKKINEAGRHMLMLVNDVLDLARIEAGKMDLFTDTFDLSELVDEIQSAAAPLVAKNENTLSIKAPEKLGAMVSDRLKIRQSVLYLISNAAKFARERQLELSVAKEKGCVVFIVSDLSPGIAEEEADRLAEAFASSDRASTLRFGGHGLGLVIAKHLCQLMGGDLVGVREVGHSPSYCIRLPEKIS